MLSSSHTVCATGVCNWYLNELCSKYIQVTWIIVLCGVISMYIYDKRKQSGNLNNWAETNCLMIYLILMYVDLYRGAT